MESQNSERRRPPNRAKGNEVLAEARHAEAAYHDGQVRAQGLALFHAMGREDDGPSLTYNLRNEIPQKSARLFARALSNKTIHSRLETLGSMPVVGSSMKITGGRPSNASATESLRLLPPLEAAPKSQCWQRQKKGLKQQQQKQAHACSSW